MPTIDKIAWIEIKDKAILSTKSFGKDKYYLPGGKRENGESDQEAISREIQEELNITIQPETMRLVGIFEAQAHGHPPGTMVKMTCYSADYNGEIQASSEIEEARWLRYSDKGSISEVDKLIFDYLRQVDLLA